MKAFIFLAALVFGSSAFADISKNDWTLKSGTLTYHVHFTLKNVTGVTHTVKGKGNCDAQACEFLVAAPVKSFDSGDGNRDNHMIEVTKAALNPMVAVKIKLPKKSDLSHLTANADVSFAGKTHTYQNIKLATAANGSMTNVKGQVPLVLSDFEVERPSLLSVKIDDAVPVDFDLNWE